MYSKLSYEITAIIVCPWYHLHGGQMLKGLKKLSEKPISVYLEQEYGSKEVAEKALEWDPIYRIIKHISF